MARLLLVRHAEPTASWGDHPDPGLSTDGARQADAAAARLERHGPVPIATSPLQRAQATAAPLAQRWGVVPQVRAAVGEIPSPPALAGSRVDWLRSVLAGRWADVESGTRAWRDGLLDALRAVEETTVVFTHFVAINVAVGAATGDDRVWSCSPAHASVTDLEVHGGDLEVVSLGDQSASRIG